MPTYICALASCIANIVTENFKHLVSIAFGNLAANPPGKAKSLSIETDADGKYVLTHTIYIQIFSIGTPREEN